MQHSISNSKQVADLDSFNFGVTFILLAWVNFLYLLPTFLSLLVSFLTFCYSSKLLLFSSLAFLAFLISYFSLPQSNCVILNLKILPYIFLVILFIIRQYTNFQKCINSFMYFYGFLLRKILEILQFFRYT